MTYTQNIKIVKKTLFYCLLQLTLISSCSLFAQVGIGTVTPDPSSILDISSTSQGLLMPRLSTIQRDAIVLPASGLMIYNKTLNDGQLNVGTPGAPIWKGLSKPGHKTVSANDRVSTVSAVDLLMPGMTLTAEKAGTYLLLFNGQLEARKPFSSPQGIADTRDLYNDLIALTSTASHGLTFGSGETLNPGIYDVAGAASIAGSLTMDAGGDPDALFIIRFPGAFTTGASSCVITLANNASANNIFWVSSAGAMATGAGTVMKGTMISNNAAVSIGANTNLEGRMFSTTGAITTGASSTLTAPSGVSAVNLRLLSSFAMFTVNGDISGAGCTITGDVGTGAGGATGFTSITGEIYLPGSGSTDDSKSRFAIYKNGVKKADSGRSTNASSSLFSISSIINVEIGDVMEVHWNILDGEVLMSERTLTIIKI
jgi:hypothetical protein